MRSVSAMDLWSVTVEARRSLLADFEDLGDEQWTVPSLCDGWTVREVLAHLVLAARPPVGRYAAALARARGSFDRANHVLASVDARQPVDELLARYRSVLDNRFAPPGWPAAAPLSDILLHGLDVRVPLGRPDVRPPAHYEPVMGLLFGRFRRSFTRGRRPEVRWTATDHRWSHGEGHDPEVRGAMADLTLAAAGRGARLDSLDGPGVPELRAWLG